MAVYNQAGEEANVVQDGRKMKLLMVMKILEELTDPDHKLTANEIAEEMVRRGFEKKPDRKGIYDDINVLNYFYKPIEKRDEGKTPHIEKEDGTWKYYLDNRPFSVADLKLIIDAVQASKFLSEAKTIELIEALEALCSIHQAKGLKRQVIVSNRVKNMNSNIHNNVDHINMAITEDQQIRFKYFDYGLKMERVFRKQNGWYEASPLILVYSDDNYYLVAYVHDKAKIMNFRVDRMANINAINRSRLGKELFGKDQLGFYQKYTFKMFSGDVVDVTMRFKNTMMNVVVDKFGKQKYVKAVDPEHFEVTVPVAISPQFFGWIFGLRDFAVIVAPASVKQQMLEMLREAQKRYE